MKKDVIAFVPVLHAGYMNFFRKHENSDLYLMSPDLYGELEPLTREIRALEFGDMLGIVRSLRIFRGVFLLSDKIIDKIDFTYEIIMPDEDICRHVAAKYLVNHHVTFESVFLRYDMDKTMTQNPVVPDREIDLRQLDIEFMAQAKNAAQQSPDWWRQVGVVLVKDGKVLDVAYNRHMPSEHSLYALGDPRNNFKPGEHLEISAAHHAEKVLISRAAKNGESTDGASIYVSVFPCPPCAYDIATAGISKVYYSEGYSSLQAQETFRLAGIELIHVN